MFCRGDSIWGGQTPPECNPQIRRAWQRSSAQAASRACAPISLTFSKQSESCSQLNRSLGAASLGVIFSRSHSTGKGKVPDRVWMVLEELSQPHLQEGCSGTLRVGEHRENRDWWGCSRVRTCCCFTWGMMESGGDCWINSLFSIPAGPSCNGSSSQRSWFLTHRWGMAFITPSKAPRLPPLRNST